MEVQSIRQNVDTISFVTTVNTLLDSVHPIKHEALKHKLELNSDILQRHGRMPFLLAEIDALRETVVDRLIQKQLLSHAALNQIPPKQLGVPLPNMLNPLVEAEVQRAFNQVSLLIEENIEALEKHEFHKKQLADLSTEYQGEIVGTREAGLMLGIKDLKQGTAQLRKLLRHGTVRGRKLPSYTGKAGFWFWAKDDVLVASPEDKFVQKDIGVIRQISANEWDQDVKETCKIFLRLFGLSARIDFEMNTSEPLPLHSRIRFEGSKSPGGDVIEQIDRFRYRCRFYVSEIFDWISSQWSFSKPARNPSSVSSTTLRAGITLQQQTVPTLYVIATHKECDGYKAFLNTLSPELKRLSVTVLLENPDMDDAIIRALKLLDLKSQDIICLVKARNDLDDPNCIPFHNVHAANYLKKLSEQGIRIVTGIGSGTDSCTVDLAATHRMHSPAEAAQQVGTMLGQGELSSAF